jgi:hypothetical protein
MVVPCSNHGIAFTVSSSAKGGVAWSVCADAGNRMKDLRSTYARGGQSRAWEQSNFGEVTSKLIES